MAFTIPLRLMMIHYCKLGTLQIRTGNINKWRQPLFRFVYLALFNQQWNNACKPWLLLTWSKVALSKYVLKMWQNMKSLQPKYQIYIFTKTKHHFPRQTPKFGLSLILLTFPCETKSTNSHDQTKLLAFMHSLQTTEGKSAILNLRTNKGVFNTSVKREFIEMPVTSRE